MRRKDYRIKPSIKFVVNEQVYTLLPTILWQPWKHRCVKDTIIDICWLTFHVCIGTWENRKEKRKWKQ